MRTHRRTSGASRLDSATPWCRLASVAALAPRFAPVLQRSTVLAAVAMHRMRSGLHPSVQDVPEPSGALRRHSRLGPAGRRLHRQADGRGGRRSTVAERARYYWGRLLDRSQQHGVPLRSRSLLFFERTGAPAAPAPLTYARGGTIGPVSEEQFRSFRWDASPDVIREGALPARAGTTLGDRCAARRRNGCLLLA